MPTVREGAGPWVDAAPFRAHLRHVMAVGDMSVEVVAELTGIPPRAARHLLEGRAGRAVRRISADTARRLLRVTSADARTVGCRLVSARITVARLQELVAAGHDVGDLARQISIDTDTVRDLAEGRRDTCSPLVAARVGAVHAARDARYDLIYSLAS
jgi:hypothetical protein